MALIDNKTNGIPDSMMLIGLPKVKIRISYGAIHRADNYLEMRKEQGNKYKPSS